MNKIELKGLDQDLYFEKLDNGLEVYLIPYKNKKNYAMHYVTKFGSISTTFIPIGDNSAPFEGNFDGNFFTINPS